MLKWYLSIISAYIVFHSAVLLGPEWREEQNCPLGSLQDCPIVQINGCPAYPSGELEVRSVNYCDRRRIGEIQTCNFFFREMMWCFWCWWPQLSPNNCRWGFVCPCKNCGEERIDVSQLPGKFLKFSCVLDERCCDDDSVHSTTFMSTFDTEVSTASSQMTETSPTGNYPETPNADITTKSRTTLRISSEYSSKLTSNTAEVDTSSVAISSITSSPLTSETDKISSDSGNEDYFMSTLTNPLNSSEYSSSMSTTVISEGTDGSSSEAFRPSAGDGDHSKSTEDSNQDLTTPGQIIPAVSEITKTKTTKDTTNSAHKITSTHLMNEDDNTRTSNAGMLTSTWDKSSSSGEDGKGSHEPSFDTGSTSSGSDSTTADDEWNSSASNKPQMSTGSQTTATNLSVSDSTEVHSTALSNFTDEENNNLTTRTTEHKSSPWSTDSPTTPEQSDFTSTETGYSKGSTASNYPANKTACSIATPDDSENKVMCEEYECFFNGHCYFIESLHQESGQISPEHCASFQPTAQALAVETVEEMSFVSRLILATDYLNGSVLTSGIRHCKEADVWTNWEKKVNLTVVQSLGSIQELPCSHSVYYVLVRSEDSLQWGFWSSTDLTPKYILCERVRSGKGEPATTSTMSPAVCKNKCTARDPYGVKWTVCANTIGTKECPLNSIGQAFWYCGTRAIFLSPAPSFSNCSHAWISDAQQMVENNASAHDVLGILREKTKHHHFFGHEITPLLGIMSSLLPLFIGQSKERYDGPEERLNVSAMFTEDATELLDSILTTTIAWDQLRQGERVVLGEEFGVLSESYGFALASIAEEVDSDGKYCAVFRQHNVRLFGVQLLDGSNTRVIFPSKADSEKERCSYISVEMTPENVTKRPRSVGMVLAHDTASMLFPGTLNRFNESLILNSELMRFTMQESEPSSRLRTVRVVLSHVIPVRGPPEVDVYRNLWPGEKEAAVLGTAKCVFWNTNLGENGMWDSEGCKLASTNAFSTTCECNHLSTFAVLMDIHNYVGRDRTLEVVTWTSCGASVICLIFTLIIFQACRSIQGERTSIGKQLCLCLIFGHIVALSLMDRSYVPLSDEMCAVVAAFLHYVFLAAFLWMSAEGHHLYRHVVCVFTSGQDLRPRYLLGCYGVPAFTVCLTQLIAVIRQERAYGRDELCWLTAPAYIWAFIGPVVLLTSGSMHALYGAHAKQVDVALNNSVRLIIGCLKPTPVDKWNFVVLVMALRAAVFAGISQGKSYRKKLGVWIKGWFSLSVMLGITWFFGLAYMEHNKCFVYAFVILNGCQGVFIFLTRCLLNRQVLNAVLAEARKRAILISHGQSWTWSPSHRSSGIAENPPPPTAKRHSVDSGRGESSGEESAVRELKDMNCAKDPESVHVHRTRPVTGDLVIRCSRIEEEGDHDC